MRIVSWVREEPTASDVSHGVVGAILDTPLGKQPSFVTAPILPFSCMEEAPVDSVRRVTFLMPAEGAHGINSRSMVE